MRCIPTLDIRPPIALGTIPLAYGQAKCRVRYETPRQKFDLLTFSLLSLHNVFPDHDFAA
jgi:hypothetical protein